MSAMVSVCVLAYNGERYIAAQLESILQSALIGEVLVSDDGSTDRTVDIVESFADERVRLIQGPRAGVVKNCEAAIAAAAGELVFLSDQDDVWLPGKVEAMLEALAHADLVVSDCTVVDASLKVLHPSFFALRGSGPGLAKNLFKNSYLGCCMAFKRSLMSHALPFPDDLPMHDWWIGLIAETFGKVAFVPVPLIMYRRHGGNVSSAAERSTATTRTRLLWRWSLIRSLVSRRLAASVA